MTGLAGYPLTDDRTVSTLLWAAYPLVVFFGLRVMEPRYVAALFAAVLLLRRRKDLEVLLSGLSLANWAVLALQLLLMAATVLTNDEALLRCYPVAINVGMLLLFGMSLFNPPSMVERFARISEPDLPPEGARYTRRVTKIWCGFFLLNGGVSGYTALYASREQWILYNGLIAYVLMGALFVGEWLFRRFWLTSTMH